MGVQPESFWHSTPKELALLARGYFRRTKREALYLAWHTAALTRTEEFPPLEELLAEPKTPEQIEVEMKEREANHQELLRKRQEAKRSQKIAAEFNAAVRMGRGR